MTTISVYVFLASMAFFAASPVAPQGRALEPPLDVAGFEALVNQIGSGRFAFIHLVYLVLTVIGIIAWRARGKPRTPERLQSRDRALPPPPRGPDA